MWEERVLLMRVETLKARKTEENERLWKREEEAREQRERLLLREEDAREQAEEAREQEERLRKRKESQMSSYSEVIQQSLQPRNRVRDRVLPVEQLRSYIERGQWGVCAQVEGNYVYIITLVRLLFTPRTTPVSSGDRHVCGVLFNESQYRIAV
jgi:hypothetical protein